MQPDAGELSRALAGRISALAAELLPAGRRDGQEWRCGSLAGEAGNSLAVHLTGQRAGVWCDFASDERGDALDLVAAIRCGGDMRAALDWARHWLGLGQPTASASRPPTRPAAPPRGAPDEQADAETQARQKAAQRMWLAAEPHLAGTPAAHYLAARGIDLAELGRQPRSLRYAAALANRESGRNWPALLAAITGADGAHIATHRTWLAQDADGIWRKAPLRDAKMTLGPMTGGTVRLWRGASGRPLTQAPEGETVAIAEGIETALSVVLACPELRVLCAVSLPNMARIALPAAVRTVILCADNDAPDSAAAHGLRRAISHFAGEGRTVRVARSPIGKDFNDALQAECAA
jgi:hypothetical protein